MENFKELYEKKLSFEVFSKILTEDVKKILKSSNKDQPDVIFEKNTDGIISIMQFNRYTNNWVAIIVDENQSKQLKRLIENKTKEGLKESIDVICPSCGELLGCEGELDNPYYCSNCGYKGSY